MAPVPIAGLVRAATRFETAYGMAEAGWTAQDGQLVVRAVVPPNTTAVVVLPGGTETEVGSGHHEWTVPDPRERVESRAVTLNSTLGEIADDPEAYEAVLAAVDALGAEWGGTLRSLKEWTDQRTLDDELVRLSPAAKVRLQDALDGLNSRRVVPVVG